MAFHRIVERNGAYRIETVASDGHRWLLRTICATMEAAMERLERLDAMAAADISKPRVTEHIEPERKQ
jgi:hypothetical protein